MSTEEVWYHVNTTTGARGKCSTTKEKCRFAPPGEVEHLNDYEDAEYLAETILDKLHNPLQPLKKPALKSLTINPNVTMPEGHRLAKLDYLVEYVGRNETATFKDLSEIIRSTERGAIYYGDAARWLGLIERDGSGFKLTEQGKKYITMDRDQRQDCLRETIQNSDVAKIIKENERAGATYITETTEDSAETAERKLSNMKSWLNQVNTNDFLMDIRPDMEFDANSQAALEDYANRVYTPDGQARTPEKRGELCNSCFMEKSLAGVCDNCD